MWGKRITYYKSIGQTWKFLPKNWRQCGRSRPWRTAGARHSKWLASWMGPRTIVDSQMKTATTQLRLCQGLVWIPMVFWAELNFQDGSQCLAWRGSCCTVAQASLRRCMRVFCLWEHQGKKIESLESWETCLLKLVIVLGFRPAHKDGRLFLP